MTDNIIKLNEKDTLRLNIQTNKGEDTGEYLEFDLEDIELPLRYQELLERNRKNKLYLKNMLNIIEKREDVKGKKLLSKNEEDSIKAFNEFFKKEKEVYDMFLGDHGVDKLLNGRKLTWTTLNEFDEIIEKQIVPHLDIKMENIKNKIKIKYQDSEDKEVLK